MDFGLGRKDFVVEIAQIIESFPYSRDAENSSREIVAPNTNSTDEFVEERVTPTYSTSIPFRHPRGKTRSATNSL